MKFFKRCSCGVFYSVLELPPLLKKPAGNDDPFDYCESCHSTLVVKTALRQELLQKLKKVTA